MTLIGGKVKQRIPLRDINKYEYRRRTPSCGNEEALQLHNYELMSIHKHKYGINEYEYGYA